MEKRRKWQSGYQEDAMVVNVCYAASEPSVGLRLKEDDSTFKCNLGDTGLLISLAFDESTIAHEELFRKLMLDKLEINKGMLVENIVAQMLKASGHELYFFSSYSKEDSEETMEIDFLIRKPTISSRHNIIPIEVKSGKNYTTTSLDKFFRKYGKLLTPPFVMHSGDVKKVVNVTYLPLYMTPLL